MLEHIGSIVGSFLNTTFRVIFDIQSKFEILISDIIECFVYAYIIFPSSSNLQ